MLVLDLKTTGDRAHRDVNARLGKGRKIRTESKGRERSLKDGRDEREKKWLVLRIWVRER